MKRIVTGLTLACLMAASATQARKPIPDEYKVNGFAIGCQAYTFNRFSAFEAIEKTAADRRKSDRVLSRAEIQQRRAQPEMGSQCD